MQNNLSEEFQKAKEIVDKLLDYYQGMVVGQDFLGVSILIAMMANGHILLESVPGLAKTTAAKVMTEAVAGSFSRIQCTPDLIPSDIIGTQTYNMATNTFENKIGPVFANFVLLDEVNRSSAKTQSAMLEAMQEHEVTIGGEIYKMPEVFVVIATQNPIEQEGTYELAEAQLDRFLLKVELDYPNEKAEVEILNRVEQEIFSKGRDVATINDIVFLQNVCKKVYISDAIKKYIVDIVQATRNTSKILPPELAQYVTMGASTRAAITFMNVAKAVAVINGRDFCVPEDVKTMRYEVLRHRIMLNFAAVADGVKVETIIDAIMGAVKTP
ncbi:MAG: MoxR family ATPase [Clostridiales bacterium]|nr:MoxR family ATPase [Clostridiales bacterium]